MAEGQDLSTHSYWLNEGLLRIAEPMQRSDGRVSISIEPSALEHYMRIQSNLRSFELPSPLGEEGRPAALLAAVLSRRGSVGTRAVLRRTWLSQVESHLFFSGIPADGLQATNEPDLITVPVNESYRNMGEATRLMYQHIAAHSSEKFDFVLVADDDVYIRLGMSTKHIRKHGSDFYILGSFAHDSFPVRNKSDVNHFVSSNEYSSDEPYPVYPRGFAYIISMKLLVKLAGLSSAQPTTIPFGDVWLGIVIRESMSTLKLGITLDDRIEKQVSRNALCDSSDGVDPDVTSYSIIIHRLSPTQIECMWKLDSLFEEQVDMCSCIRT